MTDCKIFLADIRTQDIYGFCKVKRSFTLYTDHGTVTCFVREDEMEEFYKEIEGIQYDSINFMSNETFWRFYDCFKEEVFSRPSTRVAVVN